MSSPSARGGRSLHSRGGRPYGRGGRSLRLRGGHSLRSRAGVAFGSRLFLVLGLSVPTLLGAQEVARPVVPDTLSFEGAVAVALERSPVYLQSVNAVASAEYGERQSVGSLLPSLNASVGFGATTSRTLTALDEFDQPLERPDISQNTTSSASQGVSGSVQLLNLQNIQNYGAARAQTTAAEARMGLQAAQLRTQVGVDYYNVVQREQLVEVEERTLETARQQLSAIRELLRVAAKQPTDVLGAELDVARAEQGLQQARGEARKAHLSLRQRMGVGMDLPFEVVSEFRPVFDPAALRLDVLIDRAFQRSPRMMEQMASLEAAERGLSAARAARYPSLSGNYGYNRSTSAQSYSAFGDFDLPNSRWNFSVGLDIPLFNRFQTTAAIGRAQVEADNAAESAREAGLALEQEVRVALIDLENAYTGVRLAERSAEIARERLRQGQQLYRLGDLQDYTALQQMIESVAQQERTVANAYYNFTVALLALEEKLGGPIEVDG